ncbi:hypothetical protein D3C81_1940530 [compost metagenome]
MRQSCGGKWLTSPRIMLPSKGMRMMPRLLIDCREPINSPCSPAFDDFEMMPCRAGPAAKASRLHRISAYIIQPCVASPYSK